MSTTRWRSSQPWLTRKLKITAVIAVMAFAFSLDNVANLCMALGITGWHAWLVGPTVDLSVVGLLAGVQFLSWHGYGDEQLRKPRCMLWFCGLLTLALNTADSVAHRQFGTALVDAVGPALLIGWSEIGPWVLRQIYAVCAIAAPTLPQAVAKPEVPLVLPARLLVHARELDETHRAKIGGRPISRDNLRAELRIGRDRASALIRASAVGRGMTVPVYRRPGREIGWQVAPGAPGPVHVHNGLDDPAHRPDSRPAA